MFSLPGYPDADAARTLSMPFPGLNQRPVAVNMHQRRLSLALLLLAVPHTASLATPVLETVALRGATSSSLRVAEGQADTIDSGAYTVSATLHPHVGAYAPQAHAATCQPTRVPWSTEPRLVGAGTLALSWLRGLEPVLGRLSARAAHTLQA